MIKLNAFQTNIHAQYDFLKGGAIDRLIRDIKKEDLTDHNALVGNAKSTYTPKKGFLDNHNSVKHRVEEKLFYPNLMITNSWVNVQGEHSRLSYHNHPDSIYSGAIYLKVDDDSSKIYFENPDSIYWNYAEPVSVMPVTGMCLMWPSWLKHGSGQTLNKSSERIVLSFNTSFKEGGIKN